MLKHFIAALVLTCLSISASSQSSLSGTLVDTSARRNVSNAVVALIHPRDSTLYRFVRSDRDGKFTFGKLNPDSFLLQVSHPDFADFIDLIKVAGDKDQGIGTISMTPKSKLLEEVVVRQNMAIRIKGDTIEYKADSFKTQEGASVKDLLKKFPGITVDRNGKITAQGQNVTKVLVDGEEFFSDDPAVVIENLRADAIDKVQSFDKKSDQAEFSGVDDGTRSKTLNLVLKEDKKKGVIGKVVIGGGTTERYSNQAMLNFFKGKQKIAVYGLMSNTGVTGLGWNDRDQFSQGFNMDDAEVMPGGGLMITTGDDGDFSDWDNSYDAEGIPQVVKAGAHYSNKFSKDREKVNGNYTYKNMRVNAIGNTLTKYTLPDSSYYTRENHNSITRETEHSFNGLYEVKVDSLASLRFKFDAKTGTKYIDNLSLNETLGEELNPVNKNRRSSSTETDNRILLGTVLYKQRFRKKGRTFSLNASFKRTTNEQTGNFLSQIEYYESGALNRRDTIDQFKNYGTVTNRINTRAVYTEPAGKRGTLEFNYAFSHTGTESDRQTFDAGPDGKYSVFNDSFSIRYGLRYLGNSAGVKYQYTNKKFSANIGTNAGVSNYSQQDSAKNRVRSFNYFNLFPTSRVSYKFASQRSINFDYSGTPQPPSINQLQPIIDNTDPLYLTIGNPDLKQSFSHQLSLSYNDYKVLSGRSIWSSIRYNPVQNAIVSSRNIDSSGKTVVSYINTSGNYNLSGYFQFGFKLKKPDLNVGVGVTANRGKYVSLINNIFNETFQTTVGVSPNISAYKENKYEIWVNTSFEYNFSNTTGQSLNANFWSQRHEASFTWFFTKRLQAGGGANITLREKTDAFQGKNNFSILDANISYKVFKKRNGVLRFEVNDLLKERRGYERSFTSNMVSERNYNTLSRYALLTFTWNFVKNPRVSSSDTKK